jgi:hypothetical protein
VANNLRDVPPTPVAASAPSAGALRAGGRDPPPVRGAARPARAPAVAAAAARHDARSLLVTLLAVPLAVPPLRAGAAAGATAARLLPVLRDTGRLELAYGLLLLRRPGRRHPSGWHWGRGSQRHARSAVIMHDTDAVPRGPEPGRERWAVSGGGCNSIV